MTYVIFTHRDKSGRPRYYGDSEGRTFTYLTELSAKAALQFFKHVEGMETAEVVQEPGLPCFFNPDPTIRGRA